MTVLTVRLVLPQHELSLKKYDFKESAADATSKKLAKVFSAFIFCLDELGIWLGLKVIAGQSMFVFGLTLLDNGNVLKNIKLVVDLCNRPHSPFQAVILTYVMELIQF